MWEGWTLDFCFQVLQKLPKQMRLLGRKLGHLCLLLLCSCQLQRRSVLQPSQSRGLLGQDSQPPAQRSQKMLSHGKTWQHPRSSQRPSQSNQLHRHHHWQIPLNFRLRFGRWVFWTRRPSQRTQTCGTKQSTVQTVKKGRCHVIWSQICCCQPRGPRWCAQMCL